jgi:hypothetical protein
MPIDAAVESARVVEAHRGLLGLGGDEARSATLDTVLKGEPEKIPKDMEFESLLGLASAASQLRTGEEFEYNTGCSYETFSNFAGWRDKT